MIKQLKEILREKLRKEGKESLAERICDSIPLEDDWYKVKTAKHSKAKYWSIWFKQRQYSLFLTNYAGDAYPSESEWRLSLFLGDWNTNTALLCDFTNQDCDQAPEPLPFSGVQATAYLIGSSQELKTVFVFSPVENIQTAALLDVSRGEVIGHDSSRPYYPAGGASACESIINGGGFVPGSKLYGFECFHCHDDVYRLGSPS